jgi:hypothetical protein
MSAKRRLKAQAVPPGKDMGKTLVSAFLSWGIRGEGTGRDCPSVCKNSIINTGQILHLVGVPVCRVRGPLTEVRASRVLGVLVAPSGVLVSV